MSHALPPTENKGCIVRPAIDSFPINCLKFHGLNNSSYIYKYHQTSIYRSANMHPNLQISNKGCLLGQASIYILLNNSCKKVILWKAHDFIFQQRRAFKDLNTWNVVTSDGNSMWVTKRSEKETLFRAYSSEVEVLPRINHHASSLSCKRTSS